MIYTILEGKQAEEYLQRKRYKKRAEELEREDYNKKEVET